MSEEREKVRCRHCELVQWRVGENCRRCGLALPQPIVKIVERVVEKFVVRQDPECVATLEQAQKLIAAASERLSQQPIEPMSLLPSTDSFPTMAEVERAMIEGVTKLTRNALARCFVFFESPPKGCLFHDEHLWELNAGMTISGLDHGVNLVPVMLNLRGNMFWCVMVFPTKHFYNRRPSVLLSLQNEVWVSEYKILRPQCCPILRHEL
jgi:hypothetical protein